MHEPHAFFQLGLFVFGSSFERAPEVVEDRDQILDQPLLGTLRERGVLARISLAEVVELGGQPLQPVEQLVALGLESGDLVAALPCLLFGDLRLFLGHYAFGASCGSSSSMTS